MTITKEQFMQMLFDKESGVQPLIPEEPIPVPGGKNKSKKRGKKEEPTASFSAGSIRSIVANEAPASSEISHSLGLSHCGLF